MILTRSSGNRIVSYWSKPVLAVILLIFLIPLTLSKWKGIDKPCLCQQFRCSNSSFCLHKARVCNGYKDCPGGEDEVGQEDKSCIKTIIDTKCDPNTEFMCKFGGCILLSKVCDGEIDCHGGVDESSDFCAWVHGETNDTTSFKET